MSFSMTRRQMVARTKTITRRWGWDFLKPGDLVMAVVKCQGLKKGEKVEHIHPIRIVSIENETLVSIYLRGADDELALEGFPGMNPRDFINLLLDRKHPNASYLINRIEFSHSLAVQCWCDVTFRRSGHRFVGQCRRMTRHPSGACHTHRAHP